MELRNMTSSGRGGSSTCVIEMKPPRPSPPTPTPSESPRSASISAVQKPLQSPTPPDPLSETLPTSHPVVPALQSWNRPRSNILRVFGTFYSFAILGANDGAFGALIPYIQRYYGIDYTVVSLVFLSSVVGYVASSVLNNPIHLRFGQRGIAVMMSVCHVSSYTLVCLHIPFPALVVSFIWAGFGNGLGDSAWNAWIGDMANHNEILGFLHASYGLGAALSPLIATALITKAGWAWYEFYYLMVGAAVIELVFLTISFWPANAEHFRSEHPQESPVAQAHDSQRGSLIVDPGSALSGVAPPAPPSRSSRVKALFRPFRRLTDSTTLTAIRNRSTLLSSLFLLVYVGIEVSVGGWIVTFMLKIRHGSAFASGLTSTGFWAGVTVGRLILGFVTPRLFPTEKHAVATYLAISVGLQLLFWLVPSFVVSATMVALLGFFLAPLFPAAVVTITKLLPKAQHVPAVGFAAALGASGACVFPFAVGAIANKKGVQVLEPIVLAMLVVCLGVWFCIPKLPKVRTA